MVIDPSFLFQFPGIALYKDKNSHYVACSNEFSTLLGIKNPEQILGFSDYNLPCEAANNADVYIKEDRQVMKENKKLAFLQICRLADGLIHALYYEKAPFFNLKENKLTGVLCQGFDIRGAFLSNVYKRMMSMNESCASHAHGLGNYRIEAEIAEFFKIVVRFSLFMLLPEPLRFLDPDLGLPRL